MKPRSVLDFIWDPITDNFNIEFFDVEEYNMDDIKYMYDQMIKFLSYRDILYKNSVKGKGDIREILAKSIKRSKTNIKFMKKTIDSLIDLGYATRDPINRNIISLRKDNHLLEKQYIIPESEKFVLGFPGKIFNVISSDNFSEEKIKKYINVLKLTTNLLDKLLKELCANKGCPFLFSLQIVTEGYLKYYSDFTTEKTIDNFYSPLAAEAEKFKDFYLSVKTYSNISDINNYDLKILTLGPGTNLDEYLPNYAMEAEEDNNCVLLIAFEPDVEKFGVLTRDEILKGYVMKRKLLFPGQEYPACLDVRVISQRLNLPDPSYDYLIKGSNILVEEILNPSLREGILQCGISPQTCDNLYSLFLKYKINFNGYITVRGNNIYKILNKEGITTFENIRGKKNMSWKDIKNYTQYI